MENKIQFCPVCGATKSFIPKQDDRYDCLRCAMEFEIRVTFDLDTYDAVEHDPFDTARIKYYERGKPQ